MALLEGLSSQLLATIQTEFDKVEGHPAPTPTRISEDVKATAAAPGGKAKGGGDPLDELFPKADLEKVVASTKIMEDAKSEAWKTRKEALETLQSLLGVAANKRLKPNLGNCVPTIQPVSATDHLAGDIAQMLKPRLTDINKAVQATALDVVSRIATAMNKPFEKHCRILVPPIAQVMTDRSALVRASAASTLTAIATACEGLDAMAAPLGAALENANPVLRTSLLAWIDSWIKEHGLNPSTDVSSWAGPLILCLDDRSGDVRKGAQVVLPTVINSIGYDRVVDKINLLKPPSRSTAMQLLQAAKATADSLAPATPAPPDPSPAKGPVSPPVSTQPSVVPETAEAAGPQQRKGTLARRLVAPPSSKSVSRPESPDPMPSTPSGSKARHPSLKKAAPIGKPSALAAAEIPETCPFIGTNAEAKRNRLLKDASRWVIESGLGRKDLADVLHAQMEGHVTREVLGMLFSHDHNAVNDHIAGLTSICDAFATSSAGDGLGNLGAEELQAVLLANLDLPLKYVTLKVHESQPNLISKCLDLLECILNFLVLTSYVLTDAESLCFVPAIIHKVGQIR